MYIISFVACEIRLSTYICCSRGKNILISTSPVRRINLPFICKRVCQNFPRMCERSLASKFIRYENRSRFSIINHIKVNHVIKHNHLRQRLLVNQYKLIIITGPLSHWLYPRHASNNQSASLKVINYLDLLAK